MDMKWVSSLIIREMENYILAGVENNLGSI